MSQLGKGYFSVNDQGHVLVHPEKEPARSIDLKKLIDTLVLRGISLPILIRFAEILKHRLRRTARRIRRRHPRAQIQRQLLLRLSRSR